MFIRNRVLLDVLKCCALTPVFIDYQSWLYLFGLSYICVCILLVSVVGILLEEWMAVRLILLLEVCIASVIGWAVSIVPIVGVAPIIVAVTFLIVAAVESILLFGFIVLLHYLCQASDLSKFKHLQS